MKIIKNIALIVLVLTMFGSCEKYLDVNTDPNNPTSVTPDLVLPTAQNYSAIISIRDRGINHIGNMFMYNWSQSDGFSWYEDEFLYDVTTTFYEQIFEYTYSSVLKQYQILDELEGDEYVYYKAIGKIMKAYHFQLLVDFYGDVPYTEALQRSDNATPAYDDGQTVYEGLITELTAAIELIKNADEVVAKEPADDDAMYGGDMTSWIQFANSVKLRILTRQMSMSGRDAYITTELAAIATEGTGFVTSDVTLNPGYLNGEEGKQNRYWNDLGYDAGGTQTLSSKATCATDYIIDYLETTNDNRIDALYEEPATGHLGVPQGLAQYDSPVPDAFIPELVSNIGPGLLVSGSQDAIMMTFAEVNFNLAEAAQRGFTVGGTAEDFYEAGVTASFNTLGVSGTGLVGGAAAAYLTVAQQNVSWASSAGHEIEAIITQKWIAVNGINAEQSWFDYSRTGFPSNLPISMKATTADRPVRLMYPASEISTNGGNVPSQPNLFTKKIFWAN